MMSLFVRLCRALVVASLTLPALALADQVLDRIEIIQTKTEADIHIEFLTQVHYLRHFPTNETDNIQIFLELPELKDGFPTKREFLSSPPSDIVPSFSVNLPGQATDSITIKFSKPVKFRVSPDNSGRGLILHVPLEKQTVRPEVESKAADVMAVETQPLAIDVPTIPAGMSIEEYTDKLMADGHAALGAGDNSKATQIFNTLLNLPPHRHSQELVLAIELMESKQILLFPGDAQAGNWLSWQDLKFDVDGKTVTGPDLLARTTFYKVGHHGSHNATLKEKGLELMVNDALVAMIPVDHEMALKKRWGRMPLPDLVDRLKAKTHGRVLKVDDAVKSPADLGTLKPDGVDAAAWKQFTDRVQVTELYYEISF